MKKFPFYNLVLLCKGWYEWDSEDYENRWKTIARALEPNYISKWQNKTSIVQILTNLIDKYPEALNTKYWSKSDFIYKINEKLFQYASLPLYADKRNLTYEDAIMDIFIEQCIFMDKDAWDVHLPDENFLLLNENITKTMLKRFKEDDGVY